ncbi:YbaK/EbsC family protein [Desulfovibrio sp. OttesenSCG-928-G15]|nr:YbaK/EbsC family protein [Desulfovibrio sp. OttesenSCG-928-G15]
MSIETVKDYLREWGKADAVLEFEQSCATVELAAQAAGVEEARIAKTLSFKDMTENETGCILVVAAGDARIDGKKFKECFSIKSKMLSPEEALAVTGHSVGGVCPFAIANPQVRVFLDVSLKRFDTVFPACGSSYSVVEISCDELYAASKARAWVDVCKNWER